MPSLSSSSPSPCLFALISRSRHHPSHLTSTHSSPLIIVPGVLRGGVTGAACGAAFSASLRLDDRGSSSSKRRTRASKHQARTKQQAGVHACLLGLARRRCGREGRGGEEEVGLLGLLTGEGRRRARLCVSLPPSLFNSSTHRRACCCLPLTLLTLPSMTTKRTIERRCTTTTATGCRAIALKSAAALIIISIIAFAAPHVYLPRSSTHKLTHPYYTHTHTYTPHRNPQPHGPRPGARATAFLHLTQ